MTYVMVVIDDLRSFRNEQLLMEAGTDLRYARTSAEGIAVLKDLVAQGVVVNELWLDHDLGEDDSKYGFDTIMPVVSWLEELGYEGMAESIGSVTIHTSNISAVPAMRDALRPYYEVDQVNASDWFTTSF